MSWRMRRIFTTNQILLSNEKGDVVLVPFPFTNLKGAKKRPAIILYTGLEDVIVVFITSRTKYPNDCDFQLTPSTLNGI